MPTTIELSIFCGDVVATDHTEEVSGSSMHGSGSIGTDVHRELWIRRHDGLERKFIFTNVDLPARQGQCVALLLDGVRPVALINFSTEQYVNLVALNQFELFGVAEAFAFAALLLAAGFTAPTGLVALSLGALAYGLAKHRARNAGSARCSRSSRRKCGRPSPIAGRVDAQSRAPSVTTTSVGSWGHSVSHPSPRIATRTFAMAALLVVWWRCSLSLFVDRY
jgi:hypothetical protein